MRYLLNILGQSRFLLISNVTFRKFLLARQTDGTRT
jgi:hypothetical protein